MKMKKMVLVSTILAIITSVVSTLGYAEGVEVDNISTKTTVNGAVGNAAIGNENEQNLTIGGVSGNVKSKNIKTETTVNGAVANFALGNKNKQNLNIGGVSSH